LLEGNDISQSASYAPVNTHQDAVGFCCQGILLTRSQFAVHQDPQVLFSRAAPQLENPQHLSRQEVTPSKGKAFCLGAASICRDVLLRSQTVESSLHIILIKKNYFPLSRKFF